MNKKSISKDQLMNTNNEELLSLIEARRHSDQIELIIIEVRRRLNGFFNKELFRLARQSSMKGISEEIREVLRERKQIEEPYFRGLHTLPHCKIVEIPAGISLPFPVHSDPELSAMMPHGRKSYLECEGHPEAASESFIKKK